MGSEGLLGVHCEVMALDAACLRKCGAVDEAEGVDEGEALARLS